MARKQEEIGEQMQDAAREKLVAIVGALEKEAMDRVSKRDAIEKRWLEDLAQYHGKYEDKIVTELKEAKKSTLYINATRSKTNAMEARLSDMLFPTDDRNWGIEPTPVPELTVNAEQAARASAESHRALADDPENPELQQQAQDTDAQLKQLKAELEEAKKRSRAMQAEIDDHLRECQYSAQAREVIADACKIGTGIMKGPITGGKNRRSWRRGEGEQSNVFNLSFEKDPKPVYWRVDPWNFFPDMDASSMDDSESEFERHLLNKKQLRRLARQSGFDKDAIRRLLRDQPRATVPSYLSDLRSITSAYNDLMRDRYHVWEYHGALTAQDLQQLAIALGRSEVMEDLEEEIDPLDEIQVVIWFCQGEVLKFGIHHLDSGDSIYSVFNLEKDEATMFGFGVPYIMRDPQKALSASWRTLMDNMGLSSGPQIVINDDVIEPVDGEWKFTPRKLWRRKGTAPPDKKPFEVFQIPSHANDLLAIIDVSKKNIDEETALPMLAQGDQTSQITKTASGMSILMNSVNVVFRRIVKNWDDDMTTPNIRRMYDWLMQFSDKEHIKGDFEVDARGTSVLLVREMQSANLMAFLANFGAHPTLAKYLKQDGLHALRRLAQVLMIPADEIIKTDDEVAEDEAGAAEQPPEAQPEIMKIEAELNKALMERDSAREERAHKRDMALLERESRLMELAEQHNMKLDDLRANLQEARMKNASDERQFAAEAALEAQKDARGDMSGSGGHLS